ncbi:hypothetical protein AB833_08050 [Chromatiales bacterium (ex Bugula neritina AB1)]|nr:hypothetical protein AB833_08050 [Chromatiales bacterium (ex Bugula neritina AB1)]
MCKTPTGYKTASLKEKLKRLAEKDVKLADCIQWKGADCYNRAMNKIPKLGFTCSKPIDLTGKFTIETTFHTISEYVSKTPGFKGPRLSVLKSNAKWGGAEKSKFTGFHYSLVVDTGSVSGKRFLVIYDPDVTATAKSQAAWKSATKGTIPDDKTAVNPEIVKKMILGEGDEMGPLIRFHYV